MISTFNLVIFFSALLAIEYFVLKSDLLSPAMVFCASFFICSSCTWSLSVEWDILEIHYETFLLITVSSLLFVCIEGIVRFRESIILKDNLILAKKINNSNKRTIYVSESILKFTIILSVFCILYAMTDIVRYISAGSWNKIMAAYKDIINLNIAELGTKRKILNQLNKIIMSLNYIFLYTYNYNKSKKELSNKMKKLYITNFILFLIFRILLSGSRQSSINFVMAWITCSFVCHTYNVKKKEKKRSQRKYIIVLLLVTVIVFPLFYFLGRFVGRKESAVYYAATGYLSSGIFGLEQEVANHYTSDYWGQMSFMDIFKFIRFLGLVPQDAEPVSFFPFFRHGNTVSLFGRWYWDFQWIGVLIMVSIVAVVFSKIYYRSVKKAADGYKRDLSVILYIYLIHILYFAGYDDFSFNIPTVNFVLTWIILYILYHMICRHRLRIIYRKEKDYERDRD